MQYGVCAWIFGDTPLPEVAKVLAGLGYDGVELFGNWDQHPAHPTRKILSEHGLATFSLTREDIDLAHLVGMSRHFMR